MKLVLPYPPSANRLWRVYGGKVVPSEATRKFKLAVKLRALTVGTRPLAGPLVLNLAIYRPLRRGDLDNRIKPILDALQGVAFANDDQIVELHVLRLDDKANPRVEVKVEALP